MLSYCVQGRSKKDPQTSTRCIRDWLIETTIKCTTELLSVNTLYDEERSYTPYIAIFDLPRVGRFTHCLYFSLILQPLPVDSNRRATPYRLGCRAKSESSANNGAPLFCVQSGHLLIRRVYPF